jgi:hypothetical protein
LGADDQLHCGGESRNNFAQHCGVQAPAGSMKDSKQGELVEEESRWVESQILTPDVLLFILKDEAQEIRAAWFEKGHQETSMSPPLRHAIDRLFPKQAALPNPLIIQRIFSCKNSK